MQITFTAACVLAFVAGLIAMWKKAWVRAVPWLFLVSGMGLAGIGVVGRAIRQAANTLVNGTSSLTSVVFGTSVTVLTAFVLTLILYFGMHPKKGKPTKLTPWIAFIYPSVLVGTGGVFGELFGLGHDFVTNAFYVVSDLVTNLVRAV